MRLTNAEFAQKDQLFKNACLLVVTKFNLDGSVKETLPPTSRQASKFRRGLGSAYKALMSSNNE